MNAAPPVSQAQPVSDSVQPDSPASPASASTRPGSQDFAAALSDAGGKPVRKNAANKQQGPSAGGSSLPAPGNQPPVAPTPPPPAKTESSAALVADAAAVAKASSGSAQGPAPGAIAAASTAAAAAANASGLTTTLPAEDLAAPPASAAAPATPVPPAPAASAAQLASANSAAVDATTAGSGPTLPHAASLRTLAAPGSPTGATAPAKSSDAATNQGTIASGKSAPSSADAGATNDSTSSNGPAGAAGTDSAAQAAQAAMAAAIAQGTNASATDSAFSDELSSPDTDLPSGAAAVSGPAAGAAADGAPAAALAQAAAQASAAAISAAMSSAAAASAAQGVSATASTNAADKRTHGNGPDSTLSGASNDGSVGAAQLLTSNTATDGAPTPTFKVAAGVDTAQFSQGVADRVSLMMDGNLTSAKLQVNPPALGPIEVRIALQGGHAQVSFSSHSAVTRDALESSSEKLREMLNSQGFSSVSVDISQRSFQERSPQSQAYESAPSIGADAPVLSQASQSISRSASGLLDAYA